MNNLVNLLNLNFIIDEHFEDHFICDEQINGLKSCNRIKLKYKLAKYKQ